MLAGPCEIVVPRKRIGRLLIDEVLNPFYIFQVFAMALWIWDGYRIYASCIFVISTLSVSASLIETIQNNNSIRDMAKYTCSIDLLVKNQQLKTINSAELLPGDVVEIPEGKILPCDLILLTGGAIVNEAMLTGESIPVMKSNLPYNSQEVYSETETTKHTLFSGTSVL
jgi:cation-transporting P-type ATPase 13A2